MQKYSVNDLIPYATVAEELQLPIHTLQIWLKRKRWGLLRPIEVDGVAYVQADEYAAWKRHLRQLVLGSLRPAERARLETQRATQAVRRRA